MTPRTGPGAPVRGGPPPAGNGEDGRLERLVRDAAPDAAALIDLTVTANDAVAAAMARHPGRADDIWHSFRLLKPDSSLRFRQAAPWVFAGHCGELLDRVAAGLDTRQPTAAEMLLALGEVSLEIRPGEAATGLFFQLWERAFPGRPPGPGPARSAYGSQQEIDDLEAFLKSRLNSRRRVLGAVACDGTHGAVPAPDCRHRNTVIPPKAKKPARQHRRAGGARARTRTGGRR